MEIVNVSVTEAEIRSSHAFFSILNLKDFQFSILGESKKAENIHI